MRDSTKCMPSSAISRPAVQPSTVERNIRRAVRIMIRIETARRHDGGHDPPAERVVAEHLDAERDDPLAQRRVHHEVGVRAEDVAGRVGLGAPLDPVVEQLLALGGVVDLVEDQRGREAAGWTKRRMAAISTTHSGRRPTTIQSRPRTGSSRRRRLSGTRDRRPARLRRLPGGRFVGGHRHAHPAIVGCRRSRCRPAPGLPHGRRGELTAWTAGTGRVVLLGRAAGQRRRRLAPAARGAGRGRRDRGRGHPPAAPPGPGPRRHPDRPGRVLLRGQRGPAYARAGAGRPRRAPGSPWSPTAACRA